MSGPPRELPDRGELPATAPRHERQVRGRDRDRPPRCLHRHPQAAAVHRRGRGSGRRASGRRGRACPGPPPGSAEIATAVSVSLLIRPMPYAGPPGSGSAPAANPAQRRVAEQRGGEHPRSAEAGRELGHLVQLAGPRQPAVDLLHRHDVDVQGVDGRSDRAEVDPVAAHVQAVQQVEGGDPHPSVLQRGEQGPHRDVALVADAVDEQRGRAAHPLRTPELKSAPRGPRTCPTRPPSRRSRSRGVLARSPGASAVRRPREGGRIGQNCPHAGGLRRPTPRDGERRTSASGKCRNANTSRSPIWARTFAMTERRRAVVLKSPYSTAPSTPSRWS